MENYIVSLNRSIEALTEDDAIEKFIYELKNNLWDKDSISIELDDLEECV